MHGIELVPCSLHPQTWLLDGYSWLSTSLCLELTKTQVAWYACEGFFFFFLTRSLEVGRVTFNLEVK